MKRQRPRDPLLQRASRMGVGRAFRANADRQRQLHEPTRALIERPGCGARFAQLLQGFPDGRIGRGEVTGS